MTAETSSANTNTCMVRQICWPGASTCALRRSKLSWSERTSFYTCQLWFNYTRKSMQKLMVAYNNAFRIFMKYPWDCSASGMFASHALPSGQAILRKLRYKFMKRIEACENSLVKAINTSDLQWCSNMRRQWVNSLYSGFAIWILDIMQSFT